MTNTLNNFYIITHGVTRKDVISLHPLLHWTKCFILTKGVSYLDVQTSERINRCSGRKCWWNYLLLSLCNSRIWREWKKDALTPREKECVSLRTCLTVSECADHKSTVTVQSLPFCLEFCLSTQYIPVSIYNVYMCNAYTQDKSFLLLPSSICEMEHSVVLMDFPATTRQHTIL